MLSTLTALAEPNRLAIVDLLRCGPHHVGDIGTRLGLDQPRVSKHLRVLREAGLVDATVQAQRRLYRLRPQPFRELDDWLNDLRGYWNARLDDLEAHLDDTRPG